VCEEQICPNGYYCVQNTTTPAVCPAGSYCPVATEFASQFLCPSGTFSNTVGLQNVSSCTLCTAGKYCEGEGLLEPSGNCSAGYYCGGGSSSMEPNDNGASPSYEYSLSGEDVCVVAVNSSTINDICPPGHYCPEGSRSPIQCPPGTNSSVSGLWNATQCSPCTAGYYCPLNGTVTATRKCLEGYYCPAGTSVLGTNTHLLCPTGSYCPFGSAEPTPCPAGQLNEHRGKSTCEVSNSVRAC